MIGNFASALQTATESAVCSILSGPQAAAYVAGRLPLVGDAANDIGDRVRRARRVLCDSTDSAVDVPDPPPFTGGQCPGVEYQVSGTRIGYTRKECFGDGDLDEIDTNSSFQVEVFGPIEALRSEVIREDSCGVKELRFFLDAYDAQGNPESFPIWGFNFSSFAVIDPQLTIDAITRTDGMPDDCGDPPPPPIPPYSPVTINRDVTYNDNSNTEITEEGDFTVNIPFFIGGNIIAPVTVNLGGLEIPVELNLSTGDITFDFGGGDSQPPLDEPGEAEENPTDDEPEVEQSPLFYGLIVYSTRLGGIPDITTSVAQDQAPTLRLPRTGNVYFQIPAGDRVSWIGPVPVQLENEFIPVPGGLAASGFRLVPNTGWELVAVKTGKPGCGCVSG